jgi:hypothetical protein
VSLVQSIVTDTDDPEWYFEPQNLEWWLSNFFDTPVEIHAFQLGLLLGILFSILIVQNYPKVSAITLLLLCCTLFGAIETPFFCASRTVSCAHAQLKPWYFLSGLVFAQLGIYLVTARESHPFGER